MINILILTLAAHAGKLAEGFRGVPFGDEATIETAPLGTCIAGDEAGVKWVCPTEVGGVAVLAAYMVGEELFYGVVLTPIEQSFTAAAGLRDVCTAAYGAGRKKNEYDSSSLPDWRWVDGSVYAVFSYNQYSNVSSVLIFDTKVMGEKDKRTKTRALESVNDL